MIDPVLEQNTLDNTLIIANVGAVAAAVVRRMVGTDEVSGEIAGQKATSELLQQMAHREAVAFIEAASPAA